MSSGSACTGVQPEIEFSRIQAISCRGNLRIRLSAEGALFTYVEMHDCPRGEHWSAPWPDEPWRHLSSVQKQQLVDALVDGGFFELPEKIATPGRDGFRDEIKVTLGERRHSVMVERSAAPAAFAHVRTLLMALAGPPFRG